MKKQPSAGAKASGRLWVFRSLPSNWTEGSLDAALKAWEGQKAADPWAIWWGRGKGRRDEVALGDPVLLYQAGEADPKSPHARGFLGLAKLVSTVIDADSPSGKGLEVLPVMRFSKPVPYEAVSGDDLISRHMFCTFASGTQYLFEADERERLIALVAAHLTAPERRQFEAQIGTDMEKSASPPRGPAPQARATNAVPAAPEGAAKRMRESVPTRLRYRILERDCFRCIKCGASPATTLGVKLHVDHKLPVSKGGTNAPENLQTLCAKCNGGKSDSLE